MEKTLDRILVINDDTQDAILMRERLNCQVDIASQWQAKNIDDFGAFDVIILDNDANDLQESKGKYTLQYLRSQKKISNPVIFTSFQPSWVDQSVYTDRQTQVVKTDEALDFASKMFGVGLLPAPKLPQIEPSLTLIVSYNPVEGYQPGLTGGKVLVVSTERESRERAKEVVTSQLRDIYGSFDWRADRDIIKNVFVYDGLNNENYSRSAANALGHDIRMRVNMMACHCNWQEKMQFANSSYVNLFEVSCGGSEELGAVADMNLGIVRPGVDYDLSISKEQATKPSERFTI